MVRLLFYRYSLPFVRKSANVLRTFIIFLFFRQIETLMRCECLSEQEVKVLCAKAREILMQEGNVQRIDAPVTVFFLIF